MYLPAQIRGHGGGWVNLCGLCGWEASKQVRRREIAVRESGGMEEMGVGLREEWNDGYYLMYHLYSLSPTTRLLYIYPT